MQINMIHKGGEDLCDCFPHPFHLASLFLCCSLMMLICLLHFTTVCPPADAGALLVLGLTGLLHLPGLSFLIPTDFFLMAVGLLQLRKLFCPALHATSLPGLICSQHRREDGQQKVLHSTEISGNLS